MEGRAKQVVIVGGGISGMTLAVALRRQGVAAHVVEKARPEDQLGTGINLQNNALRALKQVGLLDDCLAAGFPWNSVVTRDHKGHVLDERTLPWTLEPGIPGALGIMRTTFAKILADHAEREGVDISYGTTVDKVDQHADGVDVQLSSGESLRADVLVAADGVYSPLRNLVFGTEHRPFYAGQGVWRYTVPRPETLDGFTMFRGPTGGAVGCLPLAPDTAYFFLLESSISPIRFEEAELASALAERLAPFEAPELRDAVAKIDEGRHISFRRFDILLMPQPWHRGRVVLLGDAAHSVTPQLTSGGGMAIEGAAVLAEELGRHEAVAALSAYGKRRAERVRTIYDNSLRICELEKDPTSDGSESVKLFVESFKLLDGPY